MVEFIDGDIVKVDWVNDEREFILIELDRNSEGEAWFCDLAHAKNPDTNFWFMAEEMQLAQGGVPDIVLEKPDPVNHPKHYTADPSGVECIQITRHRSFNVGNAIKYLWRAGLKGDAEITEVQDLKKAIWYIEDEIKRLEGRHD